MKRFLEDELVFGRTFGYSKFFYKLLLQQRQPSFNHLASGSEGSAAIPAGKPWASQQQLSRINPNVDRSPMHISGSGVQHQQVCKQCKEPTTMNTFRHCTNTATHISCRKSWGSFIQQENFGIQSEGHHSSRLCSHKNYQRFPHKFQLGGISRQGHHSSLQSAWHYSCDRFLLGFFFMCSQREKRLKKINLSH